MEERAKRPGSGSGAVPCRGSSGGRARRSGSGPGPTGARRAGRERGGPPRCAGFTGRKRAPARRAPGRRLAPGRVRRPAGTPRAKAPSSATAPRCARPAHAMAAAAACARLPIRSSATCCFRNGLLRRMSLHAEVACLSRALCRVICCVGGACGARGCSSCRPVRMHLVGHVRQTLLLRPGASFSDLI